MVVGLTTPTTAVNTGSFFGLGSTGVGAATGGGGASVFVAAVAEGDPWLAPAIVPGVAAAPPPVFEVDVFASALGVVPPVAAETLASALDDGPVASLVRCE